MATSDSHPEFGVYVPNVTLAVARGASSGGGDFTGNLLYKDNFSGYETSSNNQLDSSPNSAIFTSKSGLNCVDSIRATTRVISEIAGPGAAQQIIAESVASGVNPKVSQDPSGNALRFRMGSENAQTQAEFEVQIPQDGSLLDANGLSKLCIQFDLYVPENWHQPDRSGGTEYRSNQIDNKLLSIYNGGYSGEYPTIIIGYGAFYRDFGTPKENTCYMSLSTKRSLPEGGFDTGSPIAEKDQVAPVIYGGIDPGNKIRITYIYKLASGEGMSDGEFQMWAQHRLHKPDTFVEKIFDEKALDTVYTDLHPLITGWYLLGYSNIGFNEDVNFLVENVIFTDDETEIDQEAMSVQPVQNNYLISSGVETIGSGESARIPRPGGMNDGDTLTMLLLGGSNEIDPGVSFIGNGGAGFSKKFYTRGWNSADRNGVCGVYTKTVSSVSDEPNYYDLDFTGLTGGWDVVLISHTSRGNVGSNTIISETNNSQAAAASPLSVDLNGLTARSGDDLIWIGSVVFEDISFLDSADFTIPSGYEMVYQRLHNNQTFAVAINRDSTAGATGVLGGSYAWQSQSLKGIPYGLVVSIPGEQV